MANSPNPRAAASVSANDFVNTYGFATEKTLAKMIGVARASHWRYDTRQGRWYVWDEMRWEGGECAGALVAEEVSNLCYGLSMGLFLAGQVKRPRLEKMQTTAFTEAVVKRLRTHPLLRVDKELWDSDPFLLGTPGGTVDLRTGAIRPARPQDHITMLTAVAPAPPGTPCPLWDAFLKRVVPNSEMRAFAQMWFGVSASGTSRDHRVVFIYGRGRNGKSKLLSTVAWTLGDYHTPADKDLFMHVRGSAPHPTGLAKVLRVRMASATEVPKNAVWNTINLKLVSGGDVVPARGMNENFTDFPPICSVTLMGNNMPGFPNVDPALRERFILFAMTIYIPEEERDTDLGEKLKTEGPAILRWIIDGAVAREKAGRLIVPKVMVKGGDDYFADEDTVARFAAERCEIDQRSLADQKGDVWATPASELYEVYREFIHSLGRTPDDMQFFSPQLAGLPGVTKKRREKGVWFLGIRLAPASKQEEEEEVDLGGLPEGPPSDE